MTMAHPLCTGWTHLWAPSLQNVFFFGLASGNRGILRLLGVPAQTNQDSFRGRRAVFYSGIEGKVGVIFAIAAALHAVVRFPQTSHEPTFESLNNLILWM